MARGPADRDPIGARLSAPDARDRCADPVRSDIVEPMAAGKPPPPPETTGLDLGLPEPPPAQMPELSLPAPPSRAQRSSGTRPAAARPAAVAPPAAAKLDLDFQAAVSRSAATMNRAGGVVLGDDLDDFDMEAAPEIAVAVSLRPEKETKPLPTGVTPDAEALAITSVDTFRAGGFGPAPAAWYLTPIYAVNVLRRRRQLRVETAALAKKLAAAEDARDAALDELAGTLWSRLEQDRRFDEVLERARAAEKEAAAAAEALASTNATFREELQRVDRARADLEQQRTARLEAEKLREQEHAQLERNLLRAEALLQRASIERRNGRQLEEQAAANKGARLPDGHAERMAALEAKLQELTRDVEQHRALVKEALAAVRQAQGETQHLTREIRRVDAERRALEAKYSHESSSRSAIVGTAERARRDARADVGRALLKVDVGASLPERELDALRAHDEVVRHLAREYLSHAKGIDAYDAQGYATGRTLLVVAGLLAVGMLGLLVVGARGCGSERDPGATEEPLHGRLGVPATLIARG